MYIETLASEIYRPLFILDEESIDELNAMLSQGWSISSQPQPSRRPYHIFRIPASSVPGGAERGHASRLGGVGEDTVWMALLTRSAKSAPQMVIYVPADSEGYFNVATLQNLLGREWPEWECKVWLPIPNRKVAAILERK